MLIFGAIWWLFGSKSKSAKALARAPKHQLLLSQFENIRYIRAPKVLSRKKKLLKNIFRKLRMSTPPSYGRVAEPNRMNFRKNFKRPSTPPHFWKIIIQFFSENVRKKLLIKVQNLQYENDPPPPGTFPKIRPCAFPGALDCWRLLFQITLVSIFVRHCLPLFLF